MTRAFSFNVYWHLVDKTPSVALVENTLKEKALVMHHALQILGKHGQHFIFPERGYSHVLRMYGCTQHSPSFGFNIRPLFDGLPVFEQLEKFFRNPKVSMTTTQLDHVFSVQFSGGPLVPVVAAPSKNRIQDALAMGFATTRPSVGELARLKCRAEQESRDQTSAVKREQSAGQTQPFVIRDKNMQFMNPGAVEPTGKQHKGILYC